MSITTLDAAGLQMMSTFEGIVLHPYKDSVGIPTIGIGCTFYEDGKKVTMQDPAITLQRAYDLFNNVSKDFANTVDNSTVPVLTQPQFNALFSLCYNIGTGGFKGSTVLKLVNQRVDDSRLHTAWTAWNKAGGKLNTDLLRRREKEYAIYCTGLPT